MAGEKDMAFIWVSVGIWVVVGGYCRGEKGMALEPVLTCSS
jgi:hypothetical protein